MQFFAERHTNKILIVLIVLGLLFRFYNLNWGAPYYFHPDERNIASAVTELRFPDALNPKFFAYGSLPIYSVFIAGLLKNLSSYCLPHIPSCLPTDITTMQLLVNNTFWQQLRIVTFTDAILIGRIFSALFSVLLIPLMFIIGKKIHSVQTGILSAFFSVFSVGFIQFAHFGTYEIWSAFFSSLLFLSALNILKNYNNRHVLFAGLLMGILISIKVSNIVLILIPFLSIITALIEHIRMAVGKKEKLRIIPECITQIFAVTFIAAIIYLLTNPFVILDFSSFKNSMEYESGVALGTTEVFYTQEFYSSVPVLFQFLHVYPFLLNPVLTLLFIPALLYLILKTYLNKNKSYLLLIITFLTLFLSQAFLFVKWTRYMVPTLPFMYLILAVSITELSRKYNHNILRWLFAILITASLLFAFSYAAAVLIPQDTRIRAAEWARIHIPANNKIISEAYDLGVIVFQYNQSQIITCNTYEMEDNVRPCNGTTLQNALQQSRYILLPSERLLKTRLRNNMFPQGHRFYQSLFSEPEKYRLIYKTECDLFCQILYLGNPLYSFEQTASVFDRPTVYIFEISSLQPYNE
jgi:hypothetical protein